MPLACRRRLHPRFCALASRFDTSGPGVPFLLRPQWPHCHSRGAEFWLDVSLLDAHGGFSPHAPLHENVILAHCAAAKKKPCWENPVKKRKGGKE